MLVYCCPDLLAASRVAASARAMGVVARPARDAAMLAARLDQVDDGRAHGPVALVVVDLEHPQALALLTQVAAHPSATPMLAYGPHVATECLAQARALGARVMTRGQFTAQLDALLAPLASPEGAQ